jgi:type I restriction enzyme, S subunit
MDKIPNERLEIGRRLPSGWQIIKLGEVCEFAYGSSLPSNRRIPGTVPVYGSNGIVGYHVQALTTGPTIVIGRKGSIGKIHFSPVPCWPIDTAYYIEHPKFDSDLTWLTYWLRFLNLQELNKAAAIPGLNREDAYSLGIPLPPLEDQRRIVAILSEQLEAVEKARAATEAQLEAAKALSSAYLRKLLPQPEQELPAGWLWTRLGDFILESRSGFGRRPKGNEEGPIVLRIADVSKGVVDLSNPRRGAMSKDEIETYSLKRGDLLFIRVNGSSDIVGRCVLIGIEHENLKFNDYLIRVRLKEGILPHYARIMCDAPSIRKHFIGTAATTAGQSTINRESLDSLPFPLPPLSEQGRIMDEFSQQMVTVGKLRMALEAQLNKIRTLPAMLLHQAFSGELLYGKKCQEKQSESQR